MSSAKRCDFCRQFYMQDQYIVFDDGTKGRFIVQFDSPSYRGAEDFDTLDMCPECQKKLYNHSVMNQNTEY